MFGSVKVHFSWNKKQCLLKGRIMNKTKERNRIKIAVVLILTLAMLLSGIGIISGIGQKAQAIVYFDTQSTNLGEILLTGYADNPTGNVFDGEIFWKHMSQISDGTVTKPSEMSALNSMTKTSADFRSYNDGKDVVVKINGTNWIATYLSQNSSGEPILTLWAANTIENSSINSKWNNSTSSSDATGTIKYPDNMYGTSYMRAVTLNNGGSYAESYNASKLTSVNQDGSSRYAIYTMASAKGSLKSFIEVPNNVSWQRYQYAKNSVTASAYTTNYKYNNNNDALYVGGDGTAGTFLSKTGYRNWGSDSLWLPSVAETGVSDVDGIWQASNDTRYSCNTSNSYQYYYWLRSSCYDSSVHAYQLNKTGVGITTTSVTNSYMVRPAFHLNLSKAAAKAGYLGLDEPIDVTNPYNGNDQTLANITDDTKTKWFDSTKMTLTYPSTGMKNGMTIIGKKMMIGMTTMIGTRMMTGMKMKEQTSLPS